MVCAILAVVNEAFSTSEQSCIYVCIPSVVCACGRYGHDCSLVLNTSFVKITLAEHDLKSSGECNSVKSH